MLLVFYFIFLRSAASNCYVFLRYSLFDSPHFGQKLSELSQNNHSVLPLPLTADQNHFEPQLGHFILTQAKMNESKLPPATK